MQEVGWPAMLTSREQYGKNLKCMQGISCSIVFNGRWCKVYLVEFDRFGWTCLIQERDIPFTPLDMSHVGDGYPYISGGHVSYRRGISLYLRWTCLMQQRDIPFTLLDMSHAAEGYPIYSAGHVSCRRGISLCLQLTCLMQ